MEMGSRIQALLLRMSVVLIENPVLERYCWQDVLLPQLQLVNGKNRKSYSKIDLGS